MPSLPPDNLLPGTTVPTTPSDSSSPNPNPNPSQPPISYPGPLLNSHPTTSTLYTPSQLAAQPLPFHKAFQNMVNAAFRQSHLATGVLPGEANRLRNPDQWLGELGNAEGSFCLVVTGRAEDFGGDDDGSGGEDGEAPILATASGKRYLGSLAVEVVTDAAAAAAATNTTTTDGSSATTNGDVATTTNTTTPETTNGHDSHENLDAKTKQIFSRARPATPGVQEWELSLMAVRPDVHSQGCAAFLLAEVEREITKRFQQSRESSEGLVMLATTILEAKGAFYAKRGWGTDFITRHQPGTYGSRGGFGVVHMSKRLV